jgi:hypothetical protein
MRVLRVLLGLVVVMGTANAFAQVTQEEGSAPTETAPAPIETAPAPAEHGDEAAPTVPESYPGGVVPGAPLGNVQGPTGETAPVVAVGAVTPFAARRLVLGMGQGAAQVFVKMNMSKNEEAEPTTITPDLYFGVTDYLQLGLVHSSPLGWQTPGVTPSSLCVTSSSHGCPKVYNNLGLDAMALLLPGPVELAGHLRFNFEPFDPFRVNLLVGFMSKLRLPWFAIIFYPSIQIGLNKRDQAGGPTPGGNKDVIYLPAEIVYQVTPLFALFGQAALYSQAQNFGDHYRIPLGVAGLFTVSPMLDVGLRWAWDSVGKTTPGMSRADERSLVALANLHF